MNVSKGKVTELKAEVRITTLNEGVDDKKTKRGRQYDQRASTLINH